MARTVVGATCLLVFLSGLAGAAAARDGRATLRIVTMQPVTLAGSRFEARESVRVSVTTDAGVARRTVAATRSGTFVVRFATVFADRCNGGLSAVARGSRGSVASLKVLPLPLCPPGLRRPGD